MDDDARGSRDCLVGHILDIENHLYLFLRAGGMPHWADVDLTMPQFKVLFLAGLPQAMPASQVARTLGTSLSTLTGIVDRLANSGLVVRLEDQNDRRVVLLKATTEGKMLMDRLLEANRGRLRDILDGLSLEELKVVEQGLAYMQRSAVALGADPLDNGSPPAPQVPSEPIQPAESGR